MEENFIFEDCEKFKQWVPESPKNGNETVTKNLIVTGCTIMSIFSEVRVMFSSIGCVIPFTVDF